MIDYMGHSKVTIDDLLRDLQNRRDAADRRKAAYLAQAKEMIDSARSRGYDFSPEENRTCGGYLDEVERVKAELAEIERQLAKANEIAEEERQITAASDNTRIGAPAPATGKRTAEFRIGNEPHTYSRATDPQAKGHAFLMDVAAAYRGNPGANERLARRRELSTGP